MNVLDFCKAVETFVEENYGLSDGGDVCFNLIENGQIDVKSDSVEFAAGRVAQLLSQ